MGPRPWLRSRIHGTTSKGAQAHEESPRREVTSTLRKVASVSRIVSNSPFMT